jgi:leucyl aminopeptidase
LIGQTPSDNASNQRLVNYARAVEFGRAVGRDIGGTDPERMAPPRVAEYVQELFKSSSVKVTKKLNFIFIKILREYF